MTKEDGHKIFFSNNRLTVNELSVSYNTLEIKKKIYLRNITGTTYYDARVQRVSFVIGFVAGLYGFFAYRQYNYIAILIASILFVVGSIVGFILTKDKLTIHSNASILSISYNLGFKENPDEIQNAIDAAMKYKD